MELSTMRTGRRRKPGMRRDSAGVSRGEPEDAVRSVALAYRAKEIEAAGLGDYIAREGRRRDQRTDANPWADPLNGFSLGLLRQRQKASREDPTGITQRQFDAGEQWAALCRQHAMIMGYSLGSIRSPDFASGARGQSCDEEPDEIFILSVRKRWSDCYRLLIETGKSGGEGIKVALICWDVCVNNRDVKHMSGNDFGNLRAGLNALAQYLKLAR